jgi:hypothetical protein
MQCKSVEQGGPSLPDSGGGPFYRSPKTLPAFYGGCLGWTEDPDGYTRDGTLEGGTVEAVMQRQGCDPSRLVPCTRTDCSTVPPSNITPHL